MKKFILFPLLLAMVLPLNSQNIEFKDFNPKWIHKSNTNISESIRSYRIKDDIIENDNFFVLSSLISKGYEGYLVEKINLKTGNLDWKSDYFSTETGKKEYASNIYKDDSNKIKLLTVRNSKSEGTFWNYGWIEQRSFDIETGIIKDSIIREDGYLAQIPSSSIFPKEIDLTFKENDVHFFSLTLGHIFYIFASQLMTYDGVLIKNNQSKSILNFDFGNHKSMDLYVLEDKTYYALRHQTKQRNIDTFKLDFLHISQELDSLNAFELTAEVDAADKFEIVDASKDFFLIRSSRKIYNGTYFYDRFVYYLFDKNGNLLEKAVLENAEGHNKFNKGIAMKMPNENRIYIIYSDENNGYQEMVFSESDGNGNFNIVGKATSSTDMDEFKCKKVFLYDGDYIVNLLYTNQKNRDRYAESSIWMRCSKKDLAVSTPKLQGEKLFRLYPNPSDGYVTIKNLTDQNPNYVIIRDLLGIVQEKISYQENIQLSITRKGIYWIEIYNKQNEKLWSQRIIRL